MKRISLEVREILFHHSYHSHLHHNHHHHHHHHHHPNYHHHHNYHYHQLHQDGIQHELLVDNDTLMDSIHLMQGNQTTNAVQLGTSIGQGSTLLKIVKNTRHVIIAGHARDVATPIRVQQMLLLNNPLPHLLPNNLAHS